MHGGGGEKFVVNRLTASGIHFLSYIVPCVVCVPEVNFTYGLGEREQTTKSAIILRVFLLPALFKQTEIAVARTASWIIWILSVVPSVLFFPVPRSVPVCADEATDFNPAWICRGSESTWVRSFRQYISPTLSDGDAHRRIVSLYRRFVIIINSPKVHATMAGSLNDVRNYYRWNALLVRVGMSTRRISDSRIIHIDIRSAISINRTPDRRCWTPRWGWDVIYGV